MKPREQFGVVLRGFGVGLGIFALWCLVTALAYSFGLPEPSLGDRVYSYWVGMIGAVLALYFLRGGSLVIWFAYGSEPEVPDRRQLNDSNAPPQPIASIDHDLVVIQTFNAKFEAEIAMGALQAAGIDAMVRADDCGGLRPHLSQSGVAVLVRAEDAERAVQILSGAADSQQRD